MDAIYDQLGTILTASFDIDPGALRADASFEELDLDSLAQVELGELLGDRFGVAIDDDEFARLSGISEVIDLLREKGANG
ncbi:acyl carrier protein [Kutzneria sp. NPDC052558]|uniref:acyl carrier protein n=1 Tax=Kutzneria sp. NPDC052558 TaxID=3364121 RepID=UPI0037CB78B2